LSVEAQLAFRDLLRKEQEEETLDYSNAEWLSLTKPSLRKLWDAPEEGCWDKLYADQHGNNRN
jgi:hypothetical protein